MDSNLYQEIYNEIDQYLPGNWEKITFFVAYSNTCSIIKFYISNGDDKYVDCFSIPGVEHRLLLRSFASINKKINAKRNLLTDDKKWNVLTLCLDCHGHIKVFYNYDDISERLVKYEEEWKEKYL